MSVYKRGDKGVFYMNITVNGVRVAKSTGKFNKREAKQVEALERQKLLDEEKLTPQQKAARTLLSEAIKQVYQARWKNNKNGEFSHSRALRILEILGDIQVGKIQEEKSQVLIMVLEETGVKRSTINRYLAILKTILRYKRQAWDVVRLFKEPKGRIRVLSKEEEQMVVSLLRANVSPRKRQHFEEVSDLVLVLVDTGMRLNEALALKYADINFNTNLISIWFNKGDRPRSLPMTKRVKGIMETRKGDGVEKPFSIRDYHAENAWKSIRKLVGLEGDKEFVLHALRHTCASRLVNRGIDLYVVKEWLGHSTIQVTEKYAHLAPEKLAHAAIALESDVE